MRYRRFGSTDLTTSEVGFGCARIGGVFQGTGRTEIVALLRRAFEAGITFFDTADMYTPRRKRATGRRNILSQSRQRCHRDQIWVPVAKAKAADSPLKPLMKPLVARLGLRPQHLHASLRGTVSQQDFSSNYIIAAVEESLRRLRTDYIDVYQFTIHLSRSWRRATSSNLSSGSATGQDSLLGRRLPAG